MAITLKTRTILIGAILSLFLTFFGGWYYGHAKEQKRAEIASIALQNEIQRLTVEIDDKDFYLSKIKQELATQRELLKQGEITNEELKKLNIKRLTELTKARLTIDTLLKQVANNGNIVGIHDTTTLEPKNYVRLPFVVTKDDEWLSLKDSTDIKGETFVSFKMNMGVDVISGIAPKTKERTINILTDNPYIKTIGVKSYKTDVERVKRYGVGLNMGYGICRNKFSPFIGIGISYSLIRF